MSISRLLPARTHRRRIAGTGRRAAMPCRRRYPRDALLQGGSDQRFRSPGRGPFHHLHAHGDGPRAPRPPHGHQRTAIQRPGGRRASSGRASASGVASVGTVAQALHVSSAFIATEAGKLARRRLLLKRTNPLDRRGVLLSVAPAGRLADRSCRCGNPRRQRSVLRRAGCHIVWRA